MRKTMLKNGQEYFHYDVPVYVYNYYPETDEERLSLLKKCGNGKRSRRTLFCQFRKVLINAFKRI